MKATTLVLLALMMSAPCYAGYKVNWSKALGGDENYRQNEYRRQQEENQRLLEEQNYMLDRMQREMKAESHRRHLENERLMNQLEELKDRQ